jgi:hypothetical protein
MYLLVKYLTNSDHTTLRLFFEELRIGLKGFVSGIIDRTESIIVAGVEGVIR